MTEPMIFVSLDGCAAWLHGSRGRRGVVLVPAHGFEELCSRHALRILADELAAAGCPTLRLDLHGTADSLGSDGDPRRVETWIGNVAAAGDWLRAECGVAEVALVGLRLGALLALAAAARRPACRLALLAPPATGATYLREMAVLAQVLGGHPAADGEDLSVAGFRITAPTRAELAGFDPLAAAPPIPEALVLAPEAGRGAARVAERLNALGTATTREPFEGYGPMMADPTAALVPRSALARVAAWVSAPGAEGSVPAGGEAEQRPEPRPLAGPGWSDEGVVLGDATGILCRPAGPPARHRAVLFLNAGGIPHGGWARMTVDMARRLAAAGVASLRLDGPGIGDGAPWPGGGRVDFYDPRTRDGIRAATACLARDGGAEEIVLVGACSGAHHAFHTAADEPRVTGLVLLNLLCFVWGPGYALPLNAWRVSRSREMDGRTRLVEGDAAASAGLVGRVVDRALPGVKVATRGLLEGMKGVAGPANRLLGRPGSPVEAAFAALSNRGVRVDLVYAEDDPGRAELERHMGPDGARARILPGIRITLLPGADHALTPPAARAAFSDIVFAAADAGRMLSVPADARIAIGRRAAA